LEPPINPGRFSSQKLALNSERPQRGRFEPLTSQSPNDCYLRIPGEDLSRRRFGSGGAVKGVGAYTAEVRGSNPLNSTKKSAQIDMISWSAE
jgi:hypothetical protein